MLKPVLFPYKLGSKSAAALATALPAKRVRANGTYRVMADDLVVNWGNSKEPYWARHGRTELNLLNNFQAVWRAVDKVRTFTEFGNRLDKIPTLQWTQSREEAAAWDGKIVTRAVLNGSGGVGIGIFDCGEPLPDVPLYTKYIGERHEFRVHVFSGAVIDAQYKTIKFGVTAPNWQIRNHANGWVYTRSVREVPQVAKDTAVRAIAALELDFGAVDLAITNNAEIYVFEVNTAPGLTGSTVGIYANAIRKAAEQS